MSHLQPSIPTPTGRVFRQNQGGGRFFEFIIFREFAKHGGDMHPGDFVWSEVGTLPAGSGMCMAND